MIEIRIRNFLPIFFALMLSGCGIMPGMKNPDMSQMRSTHRAKYINFRPTLIPITPDLVDDNCYSGYVYHIAPADVLKITVWRHPEFSLNQTQSPQIVGLPSTQGAAGQEGYLVNNEGFIYFPLIGHIFVAGKTVDEIRIDIIRRVKRYVKNPAIEVRVVDFRGKKVYVFGEVLKPGFVPLNDQPLTIIDAITLTGGIDPNAADPGHIFVIRRTADPYRPNVYWLDAKSPEGLTLAESFNLQPKDILYISSATAARWNRIISQLLPTIQTIWYTKSIVRNR